MAHDSFNHDPLTDALCTLIRTGELSPGERVDQRIISERLKVSRTPLREALRALESDGILTRVPNAGYAVAKLSATDLLQCYSMRTLLEAEVLRSISWPDSDGIAKLEALNEDCRAAARADDIEGLIEANRAFHFLMFSWSPLTMFVNEIGRIWRLSDPYRALHYQSNSDRRKRAVVDHDAMIAAVEAADADELVALMDRHRSGSRTMLQSMLGPSASPALLRLPQEAPLSQGSHLSAS
ncbi:GntR family transcriptional regulator [Rhodococcus oxybenzonivorans]|uniref:GntR family transcriptional regulator n=1 Tax=Rhodococcus oxybenzonivorans TaxID=1990687 RepID=UPI001E59D4D4|nr:GntR family transcriptional regulator [Rhodococcus oxybenzonivorans]